MLETVRGSSPWEHNETIDHMSVLRGTGKSTVPPSPGWLSDTLSSVLYYKRKGAACYEPAKASRAGMTVGAGPPHSGWGGGEKSPGPSVPSRIGLLTVPDPFPGLSSAVTPLPRLLPRKAALYPKLQTKPLVTQKTHLQGSSCFDTPKIKDPLRSQEGTV